MHEREFVLKQDKKCTKFVQQSHILHNKHATNSSDYFTRMNSIYRLVC